MYITSTINPLTKSNADIPVVLLCHEETRKFILRPKDYADLVQIAQESFALAPGVVPAFETSTLDICRGRSVQIDGGAYALMSGFLDEITVVRRERGGGRESPQFGRERTPQTLQTPAVTPPAAHRKAAGKEQEEKEQPEDSEGLDTRPKQASGSGKGQKQKKQHEKADAEEELETDATVFQTSLSLTEEYMSRATATRVTSDTTKRKVKVQAEEEEEEERQQPDAGDNWAGFEEPPKAPVEQFKISHKARLRPSLVSANQELPSVPARSVNAAKNNERFNVTIRGPRIDQEAAFKTRGQHTVKKVLAGACKTFGVAFEGATLAIVTSTRDEDGDFARSMAKCDNEATIAEAGIDEDTQLLIVVPDGAERDSESDGE